MTGAGRVALGLSIAFVVLLCIGPVVDPDLGFHVATGRAILAAGAIPATNVLSFAAPNAIAVNQQWLPAVLLELAFTQGGPAAVVAIRVLIVALTFIVIAATARALGARPVDVLVAIVLGASAAAFRFLDRPLLFSNLTNALTVLGLVWASSGRRRAGLGLVGVATIAGPQLHAGAIFGPLAVLAWCGAEALPAAAFVRLRLPFAPRATSLRDALAPAVIAVLGLALALALLWTYHPPPWRVLAVPVQMSGDRYLHAHLVEYRVPWEQPLALLGPYWLFLAALAAVLLIALAPAAADHASDASDAPPPPLGMLAVAVLGIAASLAYARFVDLAVLFATPLVAVLLSRLSGRTLIRRLLIGLGALAFVARLVVVPPGAPTLSPLSWPRALDGFLRREHIVGPAFVQDGWAGPFLALHYPAERVFFHPAFDAYPPGFYRDVYQRTRDGEPGWDRTLDHYGVQLVLMKFTSPHERERQHDRPNLRQHLAASRSWAVVAFDDFGLLVVRRNGTNAAAARALAIDGVDPDGLAFGAPLVDVRAALDAFARRGLPSARLAYLRRLARGGTVSSDARPLGDEARREFQRAASLTDKPHPRDELARSAQELGS